MLTGQLGAGSALVVGRPWWMLDCKEGEGVISRNLVYVIFDKDTIRLDARIRGKPPMTGVIWPLKRRKPVMYIFAPSPGFRVPHFLDMLSATFARRSAFSGARAVSTWSSVVAGPPDAILGP